MTARRMTGKKEKEDDITVEFHQTRYMYLLGLLVAIIENQIAKFYATGFSGMMQVRISIK